MHLCPFANLPTHVEASSTDDARPARRTMLRRLSCLFLLASLTAPPTASAGQDRPVRAPRTLPRADVLYPIVARDSSVRVTASGQVVVR